MVRLAGRAWYNLKSWQPVQAAAQGKGCGQGHMQGTPSNTSCRIQRQALLKAQHNWNANSMQHDSVKHLRRMETGLVVQKTPACCEQQGFCDAREGKGSILS